MRIIVDTNALNAALSIVTKALPVRSTISVLEGVYMKAEQRRLLLRCSVPAARRRPSAAPAPPCYRKPVRRAPCCRAGCFPKWPKGCRAKAFQ